MTFFNKKEEVLELKLTRLGREKLSVGQFIPTHYEFLDEDVLYDVKNSDPTAASAEGQNETKTRIKDKIILRPFTAKQFAISKGNCETKPPKKENRLIESLGTFTPYSNYKPAWQIEASDGTLFTSSGELSYVPVEIEKIDRKKLVGPSYERIPQLYLTCSYDYNFYVSVDKTDTSSKFYASVTENPYIDFDDVLKNKDDDSFILFQKDLNDFTINVKEENVLPSSDQFELEVFRYEYHDAYATASLKRLYFGADDITERSVEWYFNISTDQNIDKEKFVFIDEEVTIEDVDDECI
tara:strand:- start:3268 stop:4155 length:888 start_codon:yes stop_codon:yes gene_type:complete